eukprot:497852-Ditylum_brightwellii.AAC.1
MDANDKDKINSDLRKLYTSNDLVEEFGHLHPGVTLPNTYQRSKNHTDYIFVTPALIPALKSMGFLPFNVLFVSNHSAAYAEFDKEILFRGKLNNPFEGANRNLIAGNPACQEHYCKLLKEHFTQHKIKENIAALHNKIKSGTYNLDTVIDQYELLDKHITEFMLHTEKNVEEKNKVKCGLSNW